ncbi:uncharacterized protein [Anabrus simplex]|uniref:uncharacterized protein n=1 Tax=Anabrus simplex TaxID=316456 RepID=UPI0034DD8535
MPQGKLKVKAKVPVTPKAKKKPAKAKGPAVSKRRGRPMKAKKGGAQESLKLKKAVTKTINESMENELRAKALDGKKSLTNKKASPAKKKKK